MSPKCQQETFSGHWISVNLVTELGIGAISGGQLAVALRNTAAGHDRDPETRGDPRG
jgi:hypothetical protein